MSSESVVEVMREVVEKKLNFKLKSFIYIVRKTKQNKQDDSDATHSSYFIDD